MITQDSPATSTYAGASLAPVPSPDPTLANTIGYSATYPAGASAQQNLTRFADPASGIVRVNNFDPNTGSAVTPAVLGDTVAQRLDVSASGVFPDTSLVLRDVTVTDTIPAGLTYVPGSASIAPTSLTPGAAGSTVMTWNLGNLPTDSPTITINFQVKVGDSLSTGTVLTTTAVVSSIDDITPVATRTDIHQVSITSPAEFRIFKTVPDPAVEPNDTFRYLLGYKNLSSDPIATQDFIDVLPYPSDGRATAYTGAYQLDPNTSTPIEPAANDDAIYVTTATPGSINRDPRASGNTLPSTGAVTWCLVPTDLNTAGCPTDIHDPAITALRVTSSHTVLGTDAARYITVHLRATGDVVGNTFDNNFSAAASGLSTFVQSGIAEVQVQRSTVSNFVWHDLNHNGRQDSGEPGIPGVTVTLTGQDYEWNGNAYVVRNNYDSSPLTAITDANGLYSFTGLNHGRFKVTFPSTVSLGSDTGLLTAKDAATDILDSDADPSTGQTDAFCLGEAPDTTSSVDCGDFTGLSNVQTQWDAGYYAQGSLGDFVWDDLDGDGRQDAGEPGLPGWTVDLIGPGTDGVMNTPTTPRSPRRRPTAAAAAAADGTASPGSRPARTRYRSPRRARTRRPVATPRPTPSTPTSTRRRTASTRW